MTYAFDPELAAALAVMPSIDLTDLPTARTMLSEAIAALHTPDTTGVQVRDELVPGPDGDVRLRVYTPDRPIAPASVYSVHGGGFIVGDLDGDHARNLVMARELGVVVVSVDYRLAPEHPYPAPLEDCYAGLVWTAFTDTPLWNRSNAIISWDAYLGPGRRGTPDVPMYAAPARATDLTGLPPAYVSAMQFDPLRDEDIAYAQALLLAGVPVELHVFPGTFHGSALVEQAWVSRRESAEAITVLRRALDL